MSSYMDVRVLSIARGDWVRVDGDDQFRKVVRTVYKADGVCELHLLMDRGVRIYRTRTYATVLMQIQKVR